MIKRFLVFFLMFIFTCVLLGQAREHGRLIIQFDSTVRSDEIESFATDFASAEMRHEQALSERFNIHLFSFNEEIVDGDTMLSHVNSSRSTSSVQFDFHLQRRSGELIPNDMRFTEMWAMKNTGQSGGTPGADIKATFAWHHVYGQGNNSNKREIVVAVLDDGFDMNHPDINWHPLRWNVANNSANITSARHGTHVAGTVGAIGDNDIGVVGVAWDIQIMAIQMTTASNTLNSHAIAGYNWLLEHRILWNETEGEEGVFIVATNSSWGIDGGTQSQFPVWARMYDYMGEAGILSAVAVANRNWDVDVVGDAPGSFDSPWLISVTNTTNRDLRNASSAFGVKSVDLGAPGTSILSTLPSSNYGPMSGTSMAAPHVAGVIGLMYRAASEELLQEWDSNPSELALIFRQFIMEGVDPIPALEGMTVTGGRLNARNPVLSVLVMSRGPEVDINISHLTGVYFEPIEVTFTSAVEDARIYFTLDGTMPDENSTLFTEPLNISEDTVINIIGFSDQVKQSEVITKYYYFGCNKYTFTPANLRVTQNDRDMFLAWEEPTQLFTHAVAGETKGFGTFSPRAFTVASKFDHESLRDFGVAGAELSHIVFMPKIANIQYTIRVWAGTKGSQFRLGEEKFLQIVTPLVAGVEFVLELEGTIYIDPLEELWIGYSVLSTFGLPVGMDIVTAKDKNNHLILRDDVWLPIADIYPENDTSLYIKAIVKRPHDTENSLEGFLISRLNEETEVLVVFPKQSATTFLYIDENVHGGTYLYSIKAVYSIGESEYLHYQVVSDNEPVASITITMICCCGKDPIQGALIRLKSVDDPEITHEIIAENNVVTIHDVIYGSYSLLITHQNYHPHTQEIYIDKSVNVLEIKMYLSLDVEDTPISLFVSSLGQNYPNPFNPETRIRYNVSNKGQAMSKQGATKEQARSRYEGNGMNSMFVQIDVFNIRGQRVRVLVNDYHEQGEYTVVWNGKDDLNNPVSSGIYFYRMTTGDFQETRRMLLLR